MLPPLSELQSRGEIKRWGEWLDREGHPQRASIIQAAALEGREIPDDWEQLPGKKLLRKLLDRSQDAQVRKNPIHRDESFVCHSCNAQVPIGGHKPRDHCPFCLHSLHVDATVPGDRASSCGGDLVPVGVERVDGALDLLYCCKRCGEKRRNAVMEGGTVPDNREELRRLMTTGLYQRSA